MKLLLLCLVSALAVACGGGDDDDTPEPELTDTFPHIEGAELIDAAVVDAVPFDLAFSDPAVTLHLVDVEPMELSTYYSAGFMQPVDGWTGSGLGASQYADYAMYENGSRIAVMTITGTKAFIEAPEAAALLDFAPFELNADDLINDQTLIHALFFTCDEPSIDTCWQVVFDSRAPSIP